MVEAAATELYYEKRRGLPIVTPKITPVNFRASCKRIEIYFAIRTSGRHSLAHYYWALSFASSLHAITRVTILQIFLECSMRPIIRRTRAIPWSLICGICIGILFAFPLAAPLMGGEILEPVATLWGNALGAIGAIAAAIWAADRGTNLQRRQGASLILTFVAPLAMHLEKLAVTYKAAAPALDDESQPQHFLNSVSAEEVGNLCQAVSSDYRKFNAAIHRVEAVLSFLGPSEMQVFFALEAELETAKGVVGQLTYHAATSQDQSMGHIPSTGLRTRLVNTNSQIQQLVSSIEKAAR